MYAQNKALEKRWGHETRGTWITVVQLANPHFVRVPESVEMSDWEFAEPAFPNPAIGHETSREISHGIRSTANRLFTVFFVLGIYLSLFSAWCIRSPAGSPGTLHPCSDDGICCEHPASQPRDFWSADVPSWRSTSEQSPCHPCTMRDERLDKHTSLTVSLIVIMSCYRRTLLDDVLVNS